MKNITLLNILLNLGLTVVFILLSNSALKKAYEETFVALALIYGIMVMFTNAFFVARFCRK